MTWTGAGTRRPEDNGEIPGRVRGEATLDLAAALADLGSNHRRAEHRIIQHDRQVLADIRTREVTEDAPPFAVQGKGD
jgi:hypothetical protein